MNNIISINQFNIVNKILFIRLDLNVPIQNGVITDDTRIVSSLETITYALALNAKIIIATHLGRPNEGELTAINSIAPIAHHIAILLKLSNPIKIITNLDHKINFSDTNIVMLENVRVNYGETSNCLKLAQKYANLCDIFVFDAFATAHRQESSIYGIATLMPNQICAGFLVTKEITALNRTLYNAKPPVLAIIGGAKISSKLEVLSNLIKQIDYLIVGGGILNNFLLASGYSIGKSLHEPHLINATKDIINKLHSKNKVLLLPQMVLTVKEITPNANNNYNVIEKSIINIANDDIIVDIAKSSASNFAATIIKMATIIWNGPVGIVETDQFAEGTSIIAHAVADSQAYSLAGGGDTIFAINKFKIYDKINYVSMGGGALLEFLAGKGLPILLLLNH